MMQNCPLSIFHASVWPESLPGADFSTSQKIICPLFFGLNKRLFWLGSRRDYFFAVPPIPGGIIPGGGIMPGGGITPEFHMYERTRSIENHMKTAG